MALACFVSGAANAQGCTNRTNKLIVGRGPGGLAVQMTRMIGPGISQVLGRPVVIDKPPTIAANPALPANDLAEFLKLTTEPGAKSYYYGSAGIGSSRHLAGEYLKQLSASGRSTCPTTARLTRRSTP